MVRLRTNSSATSTLQQREGRRLRATRKRMCLMMSRPSALGLPPIRCIGTSGYGLRWSMVQQPRGMVRASLCRRCGKHPVTMSHVRQRRDHVLLSFRPPPRTSDDLLLCWGRGQARGRMLVERSHGTCGDGGGIIQLSGAVSLAAIYF